MLHNTAYVQVHSLNLVCWHRSFIVGDLLVTLHVHIQRLYDSSCNMPFASYPWVNAIRVGFFFWFQLSFAILKMALRMKSKVWIIMRYAVISGTLTRHETFTTYLNLELTWFLSFFSLSALISVIIFFYLGTISEMFNMKVVLHYAWQPHLLGTDFFNLKT